MEIRRICKVNKIKAKFKIAKKLIINKIEEQVQFYIPEKIKKVTQILTVIIQVSIILTMFIT